MYFLSILWLLGITFTISLVGLINPVYDSRTELFPSRLGGTCEVLPSLAPVLFGRPLPDFLTCETLDV